MTAMPAKGGTHNRLSLKTVRLVVHANYSCIYIYCIYTYLHTYRYMCVILTDKNKLLESRAYFQRQSPKLSFLRWASIWNDFAEVLKKKIYIFDTIVSNSSVIFHWQLYEHYSVCCGYYVPLPLPPRSTPQLPIMCVILMRIISSKEKNRKARKTTTQNYSNSAYTWFYF